MWMYVCIVFSFIKENFDMLEHLTIVDPLLLPLLVGSCPMKDLLEVLPLIPAYLSAARLLEFVTDTKHRFSLYQVYMTGFLSGFFIRGAKGLSEYFFGGKSLGTNLHFNF